ncbi:hypothetical protein AAVH_02119 [Aphelenchoides avenae]|nr:hypothetical protein AAVH_02119 [Aphelenchus avenae]
MEESQPTDSAEIRDVLVASATLALLLENRYEISPPTGNLLTHGQAIQFIAIVVLVDAGIFCLYSDMRTMLRMLLLCALMALFAWDSLLPRATFEEMNYEDMEKVQYDSLFFDDANPFNCLGRFGVLNYTCVVCSVLVKIMQVEHFCVWYLLYVGSSLGTALFVCTPALVGGLVQAAKRTGFFLVQYRKSCIPHQPTPANSKPQKPHVDDGPESEQYKLENVI